MKKATQVGITRTLNDARISKAGFASSRMVRGYGTVKYGYSVEQLADGNFVVRYDNPSKRIATVGKTIEEIEILKQNAEAKFAEMLVRIANVLTVKGYGAVIDGDMVLVHNG